MNKKSFNFWSIIALSIIAAIYLLFSIINDIKNTTEANQHAFEYTIKVWGAVESLDKVFERAEVNANVMVDSISNSYNISKQQDKSYNLQFVNEINGLVKSVLSNSPNVSGSWFQLNADLPFSVEAYNWYEFKDNQFIDVKNLFEGTPALDRKITPEEDPYYFNATVSQKAIWSDIYIDADTKEPMMTISAPVYKDEKLIGVVGIDISTNNLQQILKEMQLNLNASELYLLDTKNKVILSQLHTNTINHKTNYPFLNLFHGNRGSITYQEGLTKKTAIMLPLSNNYKIIIAIKNKTIYKGISHTANILYLLFTLLVISMVMMFRYKAKTMRLGDEKIVISKIESELKKDNYNESEDDTNNEEPT